MIKNKKIDADLLKACEINVKFFGKSYFDLNKIKFVKYPSRLKFNKIWKKRFKVDSMKNNVGFVKESSFFRKFCFNEFFEIHMLTKEVLKKEDYFDEKYYFKILVHELAHIFLKFFFNKESIEYPEEWLCYYIASQTEYHNPIFLKGKRLWDDINNLKRDRYQNDNL